jgi:adenylate cyclase
MNESLFTELSARLTQAGVAGTPETEIISMFCDRCVAAGIPLGRAHLAIDTLHPVHEGRLFRWGYSPNESPVHEYGRTSLEGLDVHGRVSLDAQATDVWQRSPFYDMLQTGASLIRRRLNADTKDDFRHDQLRIPTARDATSAMVASEMADSAIISSLALTVSGNVSAGENAVALVKAKNK